MPLAIVAEDFDYCGSTVRYGWTVGKMRHVVAALNGAEAAIVVDKHSGYTVIGRLVDTFEDETDSDPQVRIETGPLHGCVELVDYRLLEVGAIIEMSEEAEAKWVAVDAYRAETERAIEHARRQHPDWDHGVWTGIPHSECVFVTYAPNPDPPSVTEQIPLFAIPNHGEDDGGGSAPPHRDQAG